MKVAPLLTKTPVILVILSVAVAVAPGFKIIFPPALFSTTVPSPSPYIPKDLFPVKIILPSLYILPLSAVAIPIE